MRLWSIYNALGYVPWHQPRVVKKTGDGVYMGTREAIIPFLNDDAKRTFSQLLLRPGYMMRDYIFRGQHERYLAPFTALLVFYSLLTLLLAVVQPGTGKKPFGDELPDSLDEITIVQDGDGTKGLSEKGAHAIKTVFLTFTQALVFTHLDLYPEKADTPWKESLAAVEGDLRSKGIPLFLQNFILLWIAMVWLLRKKYGMSVSGAAAASAYVLCQFCVFIFLALIFSLGQKSELGIAVMAILLFVDYRQLLGVDTKTSLKLTVKTGLIYLLVCALFYLFLGAVLVAIALLRA